MFEKVDELIRRNNPEMFKMAEANRPAAAKFRTILLYIHKSLNGRVHQVTVSKPHPSQEPGYDIEFQLGVKH